MEHPNWYYQYYDLIFSKNKQYIQEIGLINNIYSLGSKTIQEIGSGTGEHAYELLQKDIRSLHLMDIDPKSVAILENRFSDQPNVKISIQNGFDSELRGKYDAVICMYSIILLGIDRIESLNKRIATLLSRVKLSGFLFFEIVDCDVSRIIFPEKSISTIYQKDNDFVKIESRYMDSTFDYIYFGMIDNQSINYKVSLLSINTKTIRDIIESMGIQKYTIIDLGNDERRLLVSIKKNHA